MASIPSIDSLVIGAGTVGLAVTAALARAGREVLVVERHEGCARETSSRNSGVIHAGIYYPTGSLKAETCVEGRERLYRWCDERGVPHRKTSKLIVASEANELEALEGVMERARANGVALEWLDERAVSKLEPRVIAKAALLSRETGIVDVHELTSSYWIDAQRHGATAAYRTEVVQLERRESGWRVTTRGPDGETDTVHAETIVNAAGLSADRIAEMAGVDVDHCGWRLRFCKGDYFSISRSLGPLASRLVYPLPNRAGLGVHITMDLAGALRAGPDTEYIDAPSYDVSGSKAAVFGAALRRYLPEVEDEHLQPDYAGVRPKLAKEGEPAADFVVSTHPDSPGMVHLLGIESPGITASLALAERVRDLLER